MEKRKRVLESDYIFRYMCIVMCMRVFIQAAQNLPILEASELLPETCGYYKHLSGFNLSDLMRLFKYVYQLVYVYIYSLYMFIHIRSVYNRSIRS